ncbi:MAG TPA: BON domain-containing protein [Anaerolineales bacterium]|nr:BON domain-containing protein [Anaerolineales bacterium]
MNEPIYNLQHQIQAAFLDDPDTRNYGIEVLDNNGIITLSGAVSTHAARDRAEELVRSMEGVTSVINEIDVV